METNQSSLKAWPRINFMTSNTDYPLPLTTEGDGAMWRCGDFIVTWQCHPKSVQQRAAELLERTFTPTKEFLYVLMGFNCAAGPQQAPCIILSVEVPLDRDPSEGENALVRLTVADREVVLGELSRDNLKEEELQQLLLNSFGDFVGVKAGEIIHYVGPLSEFRDEKHWNTDI